MIKHVGGNVYARVLIEVVEQRRIPQKHRIDIDVYDVIVGVLQQLALEAGARQPEVLANALLLLMDGAYIAARMYGASTSSPAADIAAAARQVIDAQCEG